MSGEIWSCEWMLCPVYHIYLKNAIGDKCGRNLKPKSEFPFFAADGNGIAKHCENLDDTQKTDATIPEKLQFFQFLTKYNVL